MYDRVSKAAGSAGRSSNSFSSQAATSKVRLIHFRDSTARSGVLRRAILKNSASVRFPALAYDLPPMSSRERPARFGPFHRRSEMKPEENDFGLLVWTTVGYAATELLRWVSACGKGLGRASSRRCGRGRIFHECTAGSVVGPGLAAMDGRFAGCDRAGKGAVGGDRRCCYHETKHRLTTCE